MSPSSRAKKFGSLQRELSFFKDAADYNLSRFPRLYLFVERFRSWVNWDKRIYLSFVRRGDVVLDIGANVGAHAVFFSHMVGPRGKVFAFEPLPPNIKDLRQTVRRRSRTPNIELLEMAVGNPGPSRRTVAISVPGTDLTQASLQPQSVQSWAAQQGVRHYDVVLTALDAEGEVRDLPSIEFIKIDVEGGELDVIKGGSQTIRRHLPLIYCEVYEKWLASFGYTPRKLFEYLGSLGYTGARVISGGVVYAISLDEACDPDLFTTSSDVLFFGDKHRSLVDSFDRRYRGEGHDNPA
jgi:FkbM family methyltransferase